MGTPAGFGADTAPPRSKGQGGGAALQQQQQQSPPQRAVDYGDLQQGPPSTVVGDVLRWVRASQPAAAGAFEELARYAPPQAVIARAEALGYTAQGGGGGAGLSPPIGGTPRLNQHVTGAARVECEGGGLAVGADEAGNDTGRPRKPGSRGGVAQARDKPLRGILKVRAEPHTQPQAQPTVLRRGWGGGGGGGDLVGAAEVPASQRAAVPRAVGVLGAEMDSGEEALQLLTKPTSPLAQAVPARQPPSAQPHHQRQQPRQRLQQQLPQAVGAGGYRSSQPGTSGFGVGDLMKALSKAMPGKDLSNLAALDEGDKQVMFTLLYTGMQGDVGLLQHAVEEVRQIESAKHPPKRNLSPRQLSSDAQHTTQGRTAPQIGQQRLQQGALDPELQEQRQQQQRQTQQPGKPCVPGGGLEENSQTLGEEPRSRAAAEAGVGAVGAGDPFARRKRVRVSGGAAAGRPDSSGGKGGVSGGGGGVGRRNHRTEGGGGEDQQSGPQGDIYGEAGDGDVDIAAMLARYPVSMS